MDDILPDPEIRCFVWKAAGYSLTGFMREQHFMFLSGSRSTRSKRCTGCVLQREMPTKIERRRVAPQDQGTPYAHRIKSLVISWEYPSRPGLRTQAVTCSWRIVLPPDSDRPDARHRRSPREASVEHEKV
jgi:hypothetical protein